MKALFLTLLLALLPLLFGYYVNSTALPTMRYDPAHCTRYCAAHGCRHSTRANSPAYFRLRPLYAATVRGLKMGGSYQATNIVFYLVFIPLLLLWLIHGALRDAGRIRQLRQSL